MFKKQKSLLIRVNIWAGDLGIKGEIEFSERETETERNKEKTMKE